MQKIRIDFDNPGLPQHISAVENDSQSRFFQATLYENGKAYTAPEGATYSIMYHGFGLQNQGWYDTIDDGAGKRAACAVSGNVVTCEIARQALQVPGHVSIVLCVTTGKGYMLKSWPIECDCKNDHYDSTAEIQSFFYVTNVSNASWMQAIQAVEDLKNTIDPTLSLSGKAADAAKVGEAVNAETTRAKAVEEENAKGVSQLKEDKVDKPSISDNGKIPRAKEGGVEWVDVGQPTDEQTDSAVTKWLDKHPEATTTVQDNSLTINKMVIGTLAYITPEMFGAVGDGITDDHDAIQTAIEYASNNGVTLTILSKTYAIKKTLNITKRVTITGVTSPELWIEGAPCPTLSFLLSSTAPSIKIDYYKDSDYKDISQAPETDHVVIKNLKITGNNQSFCGIVTRCYLSDFENLTIERFTIGVYTHQTYKVNFRYVTIFYCDVGFFIGSHTYFNTNIIDCWCQYNNLIQNHTDASKLISETLPEKFYDEKITGAYIYNSQCRLIRFSTESVFYGIYAADGSKVNIDYCGIELIPNKGYGIIAGGNLNPSTVICNDAGFWNNESFTGSTAYCGYRSTIIINNAAGTNFGEAQKDTKNSCLILNSLNGDYYVPIEVSGLTGAIITNNRSKYNGDGTFTYDFILNYTSYDPSKPISIAGGPTLGVTGDVIVLNSEYKELHCSTDYGTLTTTSSHTTYAYPESGTRLCFTVKYNFN